MRRIVLAVLLFIASPLWAGDSKVGGRTSPDGTEAVQVDLPGTKHMKNVGGRDGAGLCVFTSINHAAYWQNVRDLYEFQKQMRSEPGGGYPQKVDAMLKKYAPAVQYVQYSGSDPSIMKLALKTGRSVSVTYGYSPRYGGGVSHMVNLHHLTDKWACVLDNNFPGENAYEWMDPDEFLKRWKMRGGGWAVILLAPPPPPIPVNDRAPPQQVFTGWGSGGCGPVGPNLHPVSQSAKTTWKESERFPGWLLCWQGSECRGAWHKGRQVWQPYEGGKWGAETSAAPWHDKLVEQKPAGLFGVDQDRLLILDQGETHYSLNGRRVSAYEAYKAIITGGTLTDDSSKLRVTVVGTDAECSQVERDWNNSPLLLTWREKCLFQSYRPEEWAVSEVGLAAGGHPCIVVQKPPDASGKGEVLFRLRSYEGAQALADALRIRDPNYQPDKDPDGKPKPSPAPVPQPQPLIPPDGTADWKKMLVAVLIGAAGLFLAGKLGPLGWAFLLLLRQRLASGQQPNNEVMEMVKKLLEELQRQRGGPQP